MRRGLAHACVVPASIVVWSALRVSSLRFDFARRPASGKHGLGVRVTSNDRATFADAIVKETHCLACVDRRVEPGGANAYVVAGVVDGGEGRVAPFSVRDLARSRSRCRIGDTLWAVWAGEFKVTTEPTCALGFLTVPTGAAGTERALLPSYDSSSASGRHWSAPGRGRRP